MWTCPKCGRSFKRREQDHYCGEPPKTVGEYIDAQAEARRGRLRELTELLRLAMPNCHERIKWSMPSFELEGGSIQFAAGKSGISLYLGEDIIESFAVELGELDHKKDALYLPYEGPLPWDVIRLAVMRATGG